MIVYGATLSPFVRKVVAAGAEKGIELEVRRVAPNSDDPAFRTASPFGKIPALCDGDFMICDSSAIIHYFEAVKPEPALIPSEPKARARTIWFEEFGDTILAATIGKIFFNRIVAGLLGRPADLSAAEAAARDEVPPLLDYVERVLPESGFLVDDRLTLADIAVACPLINLRLAGERIDAARHPKVAAFYDAMTARESFVGALAQDEAFVATRRAA